MSRLGDFSHKLHSGTVGYDFIGHRRRWYLVSLVLILVCLGSLGIRQLNFGVEFSGGSVFEFTAPQASESQVRGTVRPVVAEEHPESEEVVVQSISGGRWRVQTPSLSADGVTAVQDAIAKETGVSANDVSQEQIGPSWGLQVSQKAGLGLLIFLAACVVFLWAVFEWKMALAAMLALIHDLLITAGVYSLVGFEVTPATVIGFLTILGYSLYDTVVVFDKVRENTAGILGGNRTTYSRATNLAVNQTLARSINTSVVALLPVAGILVVSTSVISASTLKDLSLALFAGMLAGTYSSIFIASPTLALLKEREPKMVSLRRRVEAREAAAQSGEKPKRRSSRAKASARARDAQDSEDDPSDAEPADSTPAETSNGTKIKAKTSSGSTVTVTASTSGSAKGSAKGESSESKRPAPNVGQRGAQRPQPKRGGSGKRKSKGKKKR